GEICGSLIRFSSIRALASKGRFCANAIAAKAMMGMMLRRIHHDCGTQSEERLLEIVDSDSRHEFQLSVLGAPANHAGHNRNRRQNAGSKQRTAHRSSLAFFQIA